MPGFLEPIWETVFKVATWSALIFGALSIGSAFVSAWVGWEITDATQKDADKKIKVADERIAESNARTKEAELKLEQLRKQMAARHLNRDQFLKMLDGKPRMPVEVFFVKDDGEAFQLSLEIRDFLKAAKWEVSEPIPIPPTDAPRLAQLPSAMGAGGQPSGVTVVVRANSQQDFELVQHRTANTAFHALQNALGDSLGSINGRAGSDAAPVAGMLRVVVGPKAQM